MASSSQSVGLSLMIGVPNPLSPFRHSMSHHMTIKLDEDNFLLWRSLILPVIRGNKLDDILLGTETCSDLVDFAIVGSPMSHSDMVSSGLNGLDVDYLPITTLWRF
ncbi:hypothetical protein Sjap_008037 [Stephania japonica]|uniref:Retrotransposon Copia-like N-terminal domain-containing protein n=1 Tax=Stephania japonica TaxID=461633 RepID=A0AAP0JNR2_9MAGN